MLKEETNNNNNNNNNINNETPIIQATIIEPIPNRISVVSTTESQLLQWFIQVFSFLDSKI